MKTKIILTCFITLAGFKVMPYNTEESESLKVWASPAMIQADGSSPYEFTICQKDDRTYTAFNMALIVPEGIGVAQVKDGRETRDYIELSKRGTSTHTISCGMPDSNTIKIISGSSQLADFFEDDADGNLLDELFTIGLTAKVGMAPGNYEIKIYDVKFVQASGDAFILPSEFIVVPLTVCGPTSVPDVKEEMEGNGKWYYLNGIESKNENNSGIYIHNGKKIIVR